jgi:hypothetical protein
MPQKIRPKGPEFTVSLVGFKYIHYLKCYDLQPVKQVKMLEVSFCNKMSLKIRPKWHEFTVRRSARSHSPKSATSHSGIFNHAFQRNYFQLIVKTNKKMLNIQFTIMDSTK